MTAISACSLLFTRHLAAPRNGRGRTLSVTTSCSRIGRRTATRRRKGALVLWRGGPDVRRSGYPGSWRRLGSMTTKGSRRTGEVAVLLTYDQIANLDQLAITIRRTTGCALSRSAIIRAILTPVFKYQRHWPSCRSEEDVQQAVEMQLVRGVLA